MKTSVGSEWCRFRTQNGTPMGKDLWRATWRMYASQKVKFAASGRPRNCAEAGITDVCIIGVDSGWQKYAGACLAATLASAAPAASGLARR